MLMKKGIFVRELKKVLDPAKHEKCNKYYFESGLVEIRETSSGVEVYYDFRIIIVIKAANYNSYQEIIKELLKKCENYAWGRTLFNI